ncbi:MAG: prepilin peptidase [Candidatus Spechtbacterales bacterium]
MHMVLIVSASFVFGLLAGSFLNAVIYRLPAPKLRQAGLRSSRSIFVDRSRCPKCGKILSWHELVPVFSFLAQRGRCRGCKRGISLQYPLVEMATGALFSFTAFWVFGGQAFGTCGTELNCFLVSAFHWFIIAGLVVIFVYDLRHYIIPDKVLVPITLAALVWRFLAPQNLELIRIYPLAVNNLWALGTAVFAGFLTALPFALLHFVSGGRWMGFGDVKLAFFMGVLLGWPGILLAMFLGFNFGAVAGIALILAGKKKLKNQMPFAPFLILGTLTTLFFGRAILNWYFGMFF